MQLRTITGNKKTARGDTIVEVLLAIAISGLAITGAYALASRSLQTGIFATERTEANKLAESQIEALKYRQRESLHDVWTTNFRDADNFCLDTGSPGPLDINNEVRDDWKPVLNTGAADTLTVKGTGPGYDPLCTGPSPQHKYFVNITSRNSGTGLGVTYLVTVRWDSISGGETSKSQLYYRLPDRVLSTAVTGPAPNLTCVGGKYDIMMLLDFSSSMTVDFNYNGIPTDRFGALTAVTRQFINDTTLSTAGNHLGIVSFDTGAKLESPLTTVKQDLYNHINDPTQWTLRSGTFVLPGLNDATNGVLPEFARDGRPNAVDPVNARDVLIIVTDGDFQDNLTTVENTITNFKNSGGIVYTVGIGLTDPDYVDYAPYLNSLASPPQSNNAIILSDNNGAALSAFFSGISTDLECQFG